MYVIDSLPRSGTLARYYRAGARVVTIDPGRDVVLARCREQRRPDAVNVAKRWYLSVDQTMPSGTAGRW